MNPSAYRTVLLTFQKYNHYPGHLLFIKHMTAMLILYIREMFL